MSLITCPKCSATVSDRAVACPKCGEKFIKCPECGGIINEFGKDCPHCGCPSSQIAFPSGCKSNEKKKSTTNVNSNSKTKPFIPPKNNNKAIISIASVISGIVVFFALFSIFSPADDDSNTYGKSPVGTYTVDLTIAQSGYMTTIVLNSNGSATLTTERGTEYTYWGYAGKGIDVRINTDTGYGYFMDFDEGLMYYGADDYRSCRNGYRFHKK